MPFDLLHACSDDSEFFSAVHTMLYYDPESGDLLWRHDQGSMDAGQLAGSVGRYSKDSRPYRRVRVDYREYVAAQLVWFWVTGKIPATVYHKDENRCNLAWSNLTTQKPTKVKRTKKNNKSSSGIGQG